MKKQLFFAVVIVFATMMLQAQQKELIVGANIRLLKDSIESSQLIFNLNNLLVEVRNGNDENSWILPSEKSETSLLLNAIKEINNNRQNGQLLKPSLNNVTALNKEKYIIQVSYIDANGDVPYLVAMFEIVATKNGSSFLFSSPLTWNTKHWEKKTNDYLTYYYNNDNEDLCNQYIKYITEFDKMLGNIPQPQTSFLCKDCDNLPQLLKLAGILYHINYNGLNWSMVDFYTTDRKFGLYTSRLSNIQNADPHDIFHGRSSLDIPQEQKNRLMICGSAYVYTGNWGYSWSEIQKIFKTNINYDNKTDWLKLYFDKYSFGEDPARKLFVTQFINALIVQEVEKEYGFAAVKELLASGNMYKDKEYFFQTLEAIAGINERNFNEKVEKLIDKTMKYSR